MARILFSFQRPALAAALQARQPDPADIMTAAAQIEATFREEYGRVLAVLISQFGDFTLAEDALQDALVNALERWEGNGVPRSPSAWLLTVARRRAIDRLRRAATGERKAAILDPPAADDEEEDAEMESIPDDRLKLMFTCCHPALAPDARVALTLREVCGLTTEAIAHAFLTTSSTLAQRIVRAKSKIREAGIPYKVPDRDALPERLDTVLQVIYLVFNEGYYASSGDSLMRPDLCGEAVRLARLLVELLPESEVVGLLALMLLHEARRATRTSPEGDLILLEDQDRTRWNQDQIAEGITLVRRALSMDPVGAYTLQAAIAAAHASAPDFAATDWAQIVGLYDLLMQVTPSPVVEINRAGAVAMRDGPAAGLELVDAILTRGDLVNYPLAHMTRGELCRRLGRVGEARTAYQRALALAQQEPERRFFERRLAGLAQ